MFFFVVVVVVYLYIMPFFRATEYTLIYLCAFMSLNQHIIQEIGCFQQNKCNDFK